MVEYKFSYNNKPPENITVNWNSYLSIVIRILDWRILLHRTYKLGIPPQYHHFLKSPSCLTLGLLYIWNVTTGDFKLVRSSGWIGRLAQNKMSYQNSAPIFLVTQKFQLALLNFTFPFSRIIYVVEIFTSRSLRSKFHFVEGYSNMEIIKNFQIIVDILILLQSYTSYANYYVLIVSRSLITWKFWSGPATFAIYISNWILSNNFEKKYHIFQVWKYTKLFFFSKMSFLAVKQTRKNWNYD